MYWKEDSVIAQDLAINSCGCFLGLSSSLFPFEPDDDIVLMPLLPPGGHWV